MTQIPIVNSTPLLEEIRNRVNLKLNQKHKEIIVSVYLKMIDRHNSFCGCNYCQILSEYVFYKKYLAGKIRHYSRINYYRPEEEILFLTNIRLLENKIKSIKKEKDLLKTLE